MSERVSAALHVVDRARYCLDDLGNRLPQTSAPEMIARMLQLLDVRPGHRVLEIGTGSGYSTALLAELTGLNGSIVSIDVDAEMTRRATRLLADASYDNILLVSADGREGLPSHRPFDRVVAWCSVTDTPGVARPDPTWCCAGRGDTRRR